MQKTKTNGTCVFQVLVLFEGLATNLLDEGIIILEHWRVADAEWASARPEHVDAGRHRDGDEAIAVVIKETSSRVALEDDAWREPVL